MMIIHAMKAAPSILATIARIINHMAAPILATNRAVVAAKMPIMSIAIPQKNAPSEYSGKNISKKMFKAAAIPKIINNILPIKTRINPIFAKVLEIRFTS